MGKDEHDLLWFAITTAVYNKQLKQIIYIYIEISDYKTDYILRAI